MLAGSTGRRKTWLMAIPEEAVRSGLLLPVPSWIRPSFQSPALGANSLQVRELRAPCLKVVPPCMAKCEEQLRAFFQWQNQRRCNAHPLGGGTPERLCTNLSKRPYLSSEHQSIPQPSTQRQH